MIPTIYDIFKHQYPQLLSQVLVLNYGWIHAGIWGMVKTFLTVEAREKLVFISYDQLQEYIPIENIPIGM